MNLGNRLGQKSALLLIDYEKTYDRIEWGLFMMMLEALGFPPDYCKMVSILLFRAMASMEINRVRFEFYSLCRSIRHGGPLAPYLFVIASNSLH